MGDWLSRLSVPVGQQLLKITVKCMFTDCLAESNF